MSTFDAIEIGWAGKKYTIPPDRVLRCIADVEEVLTLHEILAMGEEHRVKLAPISRAYAVVLRFAGCKVTDEEAFARIFHQGSSQEEALKCVAGLLTMMLPRDAKMRAGVIMEAADVTKGKARSPRSRGGSSSRRSGKRRS